MIRAVAFMNKGSESNQRSRIPIFFSGTPASMTLFFAVSSVLIIRLKDYGGLAAELAALMSFVGVLLLGEILPKSLAYANSRNFCVAAALPAYLCLQIFGPVELVFKVVILEPTLRLLLGPVRYPEAITVGEFKSLIETTRKQGLITADENKLFTEVIELGFLKVRHVMRPRVDMITSDVTESSKAASEKMKKNHLTKLPVYVRSIDNIIGLVRLRQILLRGEIGTAPLDREGPSLTVAVPDTAQKAFDSPPNIHIQ